MVSMKNDSMATNSNAEISVVRFFLSLTTERIWCGTQVMKTANHLDFRDAETIRIESNKRKGNNDEQNKKNDIVKIFFFCSV